MTTLQQFVRRWTRLCTPRHIHETTDPEIERKAVLVTVVGLVLLVAAVAYGALYAALGMHRTAAGVGVAVVVLVLSMRRFKRDGAVVPAAHALSATLALTLAAIMFGTGFHQSMAVSWMPLAPMIALMMGDRRIMATWGAVSATAVIGLSVLGWTGLGPPSETPAYAENVLNLAITAGAIGAYGAVALLYDASRVRAMSLVDQSRAAAETAQQTAQRAHEDARLVLDNVDQGLIMVDPKGKLCGARSGATADLLSPPTTGQRLWDWLAAHDATAASWLEIGWDELDSDWMPEDLAIDQLPKRLRAGDRQLALDYRTIRDDSGALERVLLVISDITATLAAAEAERAGREMLAVFSLTRRDPTALGDFLAEARQLVEAIAGAAGSPADEKRWIHTLKGSGALMGLERLAEALHSIEDRLAEDGTGLTASEREAVLQLWDETASWLAPLAGEQDDEALVVHEDDVETVRELLGAGAEVAAVLETLDRWSWDKADQRLGRLADQSRALADRLGKDHVEVEVAAPGLRTPPSDAWRALYGSLVHAVRNALDHGVETAEERRQHGKPATARLRFHADQDDESVRLRIEDDGRGIAWEALVEKARTKGIDIEHPEELLFMDGLSSRDEVSSVSGRGVGMAAVRQAARALGGEVHIASTAGAGTTVEIRIPAAEAAEAAALTA